MESIDSFTQKGQSAELPIHFFTIVLNGEPFIRYHIEIFQQLPLKWHWHIVEGVADLKHDTGWSLALGGRIVPDIHRNGRSNDGTTEYLDELARRYPDRVTVYRKPAGVFWDGKHEMVNAPLANIQQESLLWQVDVDELWTVEQICKARKMFVQHPEKTAAFYWCWYFVGENLVISSRNCYTQNPRQEWLRTWRFKPGAVWVSHEPPRLVEPLPTGQWRDIASVNPFGHDETEKQGLVFQHFAYVTPNQLYFKEQYYGYQNALSHWMALQSQTKFPVRLSQYFPWVGDETMVNTVESCGVVPLAKRNPKRNVWQFVKTEEHEAVESENSSIKIILDGVFFQLNNTGIARVWKSLLEEWAANGFAKHILVLDRAGTAPRITGIKYLCVKEYNYNKTEGDRAVLQQICNEELANLFVSTYYTTPLSTPSVFIAYDMIPEVMGLNLEHPMWREKHYGIRHASAYIAISENTARDLLRFLPHISRESVTIARSGLTATFYAAMGEEVYNFKSKYGISEPYFILVGDRVGWYGYKNTILFFRAFAKLGKKREFEIVCVGGESVLETEFRAYTSDTTVHVLQLSDDELRTAYSGAVALVYPSKYEGFGLPVLEAIACGCPVITCANGAIPEVAGLAAIYVKDNDIDGLANALLQVQKPHIRNELIAAGLEQAKKFSWSKMANTVSSALIAATRLPAKKSIQTPQFLTKLSSCVEQYKNSPSNQSALAELRQSRQEIAKVWLATATEQLENVYSSDVGKNHQILLTSGIKDEAIAEDEQTFVAETEAQISRGFDEPNAMQYLLAAMLYRRSDELPLKYQGAPIAKWFFNDFLKFMLDSPNYFKSIGEADKYCRYMQGLVDYLHRRIFSNTESKIWEEVAWFFTQTANFIPLYFTTASLQHLYNQRADIMTFALQTRGHQLDYTFGERAGDRAKIRLGVLNEHFNPQTETFITIPTFEHLNRDQFEIILYAVNISGSALEQYCQSRADRLVKLPNDLVAQVQLIRNDDLDILLIGTNLTAVTKPTTLLAQHRLARVQVTSMSSPIPTGMRHIDYYIAGNLTAPVQSEKEPTRERLITISGSGLCFHYPIETDVSQVKIDRKSLGLSEDAVVFISGANFYKLIPELMTTWAKIIAAVPNSVLFLYPFNPNWRQNYPISPFINSMKAIFAKHGIEKRCLVLSKALPSRADIKELLKLGDVYLDSYPYSGATSLVDPLEVGLPLVVMEGNALRFRQASAMLRELQLQDLIANSEEAYIRLSVAIATNPEMRLLYRQQIQQKMLCNPPFLDSRSYCSKMGALFQEIFQKWQNNSQPGSDAYPTKQFLNRLKGCVNLYHIDPSDQSVLAELRLIRRQLADFWLSLPHQQLEGFYKSDVGNAHQNLCNSGILDEPLNEAEQSFVDELAAGLARGLNAPKAINYQLAAMLYRRGEPARG